MCGAFLLKFKIWVGAILVHISNEFEAMNISYCFGTYVSMREFSVSDVFPKPFYIALPVQTECGTQSTAKTYKSILWTIEEYYYMSKG